MHILVIEDQKKVAAALKEGLEQHDYTVSVAPTGEEGFFLLHAEPIDLVILDLGLPRHDGIEILKTMREEKTHVPVLIVTARDSLEDRIAGLEAGADDYMVKPFAFPELLARVHALLRRSAEKEETILQLKDLVYDRATRGVTRNGQRISLTAKELELLEYLMLKKNTVVTREMLARDVWKATSRATPLDNVIDVHIAHLRKKIDICEPKLLHTIRGVGFILSITPP
jgi:DNA-binding response OmpR family regulator